MRMTACVSRRRNYICLSVLHLVIPIAEKKKKDVSHV